MIPPQNLPVALRVLQAALCLLTLVSAGATNYSIDYTSSHFVYHGSWENTTGSLDASGGHTSTNVPGAFATISYNFSSVYILSAKWPYTVSTSYSIDGKNPFTIDMQDHSRPATAGGNASISAQVVGNWTSTMNQQHTINIALPPGADESGSQFAVVDRLVFEVLDDSSTTSSTSPSQTSTTSASSSSSISASSTPFSSTPFSSTPFSSTPFSSTPFSSTPFSSTPFSSSVPAGSSSGHVFSTAHVRDLAISVSILGTFALLLLLLLWRFCNRRRKNDGDIDPITPRYHPVGIGIDSPNSFATSGASMRESPMFSPGSDAKFPLNDDNSASTSDNLQHPPIALDYHPVISSNNSPLSPIAALRTPATPYHLSTPSMTTDRDSIMYSRIPILDESSAVSSSSGNRDINEKSRNASRISRSTLAESRDESLLVPTAIQENVWDSGYPQPLKFIPII